MNTTEVAVPQPWRDLMQEQNDRITALEQKNDKLVAALKAMVGSEYSSNPQVWIDAMKQARAALKELGE